MCEFCAQVAERLHGEAMAAEAETVIETEAVETVSDAAVEIARIEADRDIEIAKQDVKREEVWQEARVAELEGEVRGMRELLDRLVPEPEPEPEPVVVVADPPADPEPTEPEVTDLPPAEPKPRAKKSNGWF